MAALTNPVEPGVAFDWLFHMGFGKAEMYGKFWAANQNLVLVLPSVVELESP